MREEIITDWKLVYEDREWTFLELKKIQYLRKYLSVARKFSRKEILEFASRRVNESRVRRMIDDLFIRAQQLKLSHLKRAQEEFKEDGDIAETLSYFIKNPSLETYIFKEIMGSRFEIESYPVRLSNTEKNMGAIKECCQLNDTDMEILTIFYLKEIDGEFEELFNEVSRLWCGNSSERFENKSSIRIIKLLTGINPGKLRRSLSSESGLKKFGLLDKDADLNSKVVEFLTSDSDSSIEVLLEQLFFKKSTRDSIALDKHMVAPKSLKLILSALENCKKVLFYGDPGTGKTELALALGHYLERNVYEVITPKDSKIYFSGKDERRYRAVTASNKILNPGTDFMIVDEADELLNISSFFSFDEEKKCKINNILEEVKGPPQIWITNRLWGIDDSTTRRFDYCLKFEKSTYLQRRNIWNYHIQELGMEHCFTTDIIEYLSEKYELNAGMIARSLKNAELSSHVDDKNAVLEIVENTLKSYMEVLDIKDKANIKKANINHYGIEGLNINGDLKQSLNLLKRFNEVFWPQDDPQIKNMNVLLYGAPGTGKTEFAKYIARHLKRRLILKRGSDLESCWIGEMEKNICRAFQEAEQDKAILFLDEADSFFSKRENAIRSWEVSQVNEVLTWMESFQGILICSTNLRDKLDLASLRRFNISLEFKSLSSNGKLIFYRRILEGLVGTPLTDDHIGYVMDLPEITPGDFKVVYNQVMLLKECDRNHHDIIASLENIARETKPVQRQIQGFAV